MHLVGSGRSHNYSLFVSPSGFLLIWVTSFFSHTMAAPGSSWHEVSWRLKKRKTDRPKKRGQGGPALSAPAERQRVAVHDNLALEAQAMMQRSAFDHALHGWAETSRRGRDASIVVQLILSEQRRVGGDTLLRSEVDCLVSNAICLEPQRMRCGWRPPAPRCGRPSGSRAGAAAEAA